MILSILIATVKGREKSFDKLIKTLESQTCSDVEVLSLKDNKELSIGNKRQTLIEMASGDYVCFIDDDDSVAPDYIERILGALEQKPDCVGFKILCTTNGTNPRTACGSLRYKVWANNKDGYDYVRSPYHKNPILRSAVLQIGFKDMRFGEDHDFSKRMSESGLLQHEVFINDYMYYYQYSTKENHNKKYGIRK